MREQELNGKDSPGRNSFPFLLGTTSYIIPDEIISNVRYLAPLVDDIELVLFESDTIANIPSLAEIDELRVIAQGQDCGFTVHLPTDRKAGASDRAARRAFCDAASRIIDRTRLLSPRAWVLHLEGIASNASPEDITLWQERCEETVFALAAETGNPGLLAIENLAYPLAWHLSIAARHKTSLCLDIGHLWVQPETDWERASREALPSATVIHLHGVQGSRDHISLRAGELSRHHAFFSLLQEVNYGGVITLEIFNERDFAESLEVIDALWANLHW